MQTHVHHPAFVGANTLDRGKCSEFNVIRMADDSGRGGVLVLFIKDDWSDWDQLVAAVEAYRAHEAAA